ncbi:Gfo/Idh/MocA family protein [Granulicella arctica]|uniref:Gfo/Idh/MocA family protein n=1 Tax=Granulicella arctica TaxID=940613 RepID=UPI0021E03095|nr:Gfo/Idh/MocA family oxidoreductase [Granulicella arctica]
MSLTRRDLTRRDFGRLAAASAAFATVPRAIAQAAAPKKIRYAIIGLGRISLQHFMPGTKMSAMSEVTAFVSGHPDKAKQHAAEYNIPDSSIYTYENFDRIRDNPNVDAVYIALPNSMHAEYTIRSAQAGKHVLCEKPMATSVADSEAMIAACKKANRKLMIAYRCQLEPTTLRAREFIRNGTIGAVQAIESANGFNIGPDWRTNGKLAGGGPLMDVGIYSLNACRFMLGEEPTVIAANASTIDHDGRFNDVEENVSWTMKFPSGVLASCNTTYGANMEGYYRIHGSKGTLNVEPAFGYEGIHLTGRVRGAQGPPTVIDLLEQEKDPAQFAREADHFSGCILNNTPVGPSGEEGLRDMRHIQTIYKAAGIKF